MALQRGVRAAALKLLLLMFVGGLLAASSGLQNPRHHASIHANGRRPPVIAVDLGNTNSCAAVYGPPGNDDGTMLTTPTPTLPTPSSVSSACSG
ncbi:hypothetical protein U9M48_034904 [Paspalum notatum var. saurae]|uniref:Uncharacterized protein n=1 Tax=Paspalum notatum var. saurae TaxID=547442 RepID=A0AAQ3X9F7_PASNO